MKNRHCTKAHFTNSSRWHIRTTFVTLFPVDFTEIKVKETFLAVAVLTCILLCSIVRILYLPILQRMFSIATAIFVCCFVFTCRKTFANLQFGGGSLVQSRICFFRATPVSNRPLNINFASNTKSMHITSLLKKGNNDSLFFLCLTAITYLI